SAADLGRDRGAGVAGRTGVVVLAPEGGGVVTPERWREITAIFHAALARDAAERPALVAARCGDDEDLRRELEQMLAAHDNASKFGDTPAFAAAGQLLSM